MYLESYNANGAGCGMRRPSQTLTDASSWIVVSAWRQQVGCEAPVGLDATTLGELLAQGAAARSEWCARFGPFLEVSGALESYLPMAFGGRSVPDTYAAALTANYGPPSCRRS